MSDIDELKQRIKGLAEVALASEAREKKYKALEAEARGLLVKARACVDRPWMGCSMDHNTIENWLGDVVDALDQEQS